MHPAVESADIAAIRSIIQAWNAGWNTSNAAALASLFTDDAVLMPQGQPAMIGRESIAAAYRSVFEEVAVKGSGEILEIEVAGEWAFYRSTYQLTALPKAGGDPVHDAGKAVHILKRQRDNSWKIARLIANSDQPSPGG